MLQPPEVVPPGLLLPIVLSQHSNGNGVDPRAYRIPFYAEHPNRIVLYSPSCQPSTSAYILPPAYHLAMPVLPPAKLELPTFFDDDRKPSTYGIE